MTAAERQFEAELETFRLFRIIHHPPRLFRLAACPPRFARAIADLLELLQICSRHCSSVPGQFQRIDLLFVHSPLFAEKLSGHAVSFI